MPSIQPLLKLEKISKSFGGVSVLDAVEFDVRGSEVHALVGENGAGKSTLMKIVTGVYSPDSGSMYWKGRRSHVRTPRHAHELGISMVHQELMLVPQLSAGENIFLGRHPLRNASFRWVEWREIRRRAAALLEELGHPIDPARAVAELSVAEQQLVEIARALAFSAALIIMDEPTAPLSDREVKRLFQVIAQLKERGVSVVFISHRLKEIYEIADRVTVLRDGKWVATLPVAETTPETLVRHMVGRDVGEYFPQHKPEFPSQEVLRAEGLTAKGKFYNINFSLRGGEILGLAGLVGAGRTELLESLFGAGEREAGRVYLNGRLAAIRTPVDAVRQGVALVADDRKEKGLVLTSPVQLNIALAGQRKYARFGWLLEPETEKEMAGRLARRLRIRAPLTQPVMYLSGGNQQKVVLARWLMADAKIFLLDEPTRGIDVGSKAEIYEMIRRLAEGGAAILLVSSELEEILRLADRILVMHRGRIAGELRREEATEESIMRLATGSEDRE